MTPLPWGAVVLHSRNPTLRNTNLRTTERGQVTIPIALRRKHAIFPDTELAFVEEGDKIVLQINDQRTPGRRLVDHLAGSATTNITVDELMMLSRGER